MVMAARTWTMARTSPSCCTVADLWFHSMVALAHYGLTPADVIAELERREGTSGIEEKPCARRLRGPPRRALHE